MACNLSSPFLHFACKGKGKRKEKGQAGRRAIKKREGRKKEKRKEKEKEKEKRKGKEKGKKEKEKKNEPTHPPSEMKIGHRASLRFASLRTVPLMK